MDSIYVPYKLAVKLEDCRYSGQLDNAVYPKGERRVYPKEWIKEGEVTPAPMYWCVLAWLRDLHRIHIVIDLDEEYWKPVLYDFSHGNKYIPTGERNFSIYSQAVDYAIEQAIKLISYE